MRKLEDFIVEGIMLKAGWQPLEPYVNHRHKWKSNCLVCEKVSTPTLKMVKKSSLFSLLKKIFVIIVFIKMYFSFTEYFFF